MFTIFVNILFSSKSNFKVKFKILKFIYILLMWTYIIFIECRFDKSASLVVLQHLIEQNANLGTKSNKGWTVLHFASEGSDMKIAKYLIEEKKIGTQKYISYNFLTVWLLVKHWNEEKIELHNFVQVFIKIKTFWSLAILNFFILYFLFLNWNYRSLDISVSPMSTD